jgi:Fe-S cluster assembly protein SufB
VFDSVSVVTTFKKELKKAGVIFMSISEAIREHPDLVKKYLGTVVPTSDNFYATLNSAVFTDGSFVYVPQGRALPDGAVDLFPHQREATPASSSAR